MWFQGIKKHTVYVEYYGGHFFHSVTALYPEIWRCSRRQVIRLNKVGSVSPTASWSNSAARSVTHAVRFRSGRTLGFVFVDSQRDGGHRYGVGRLSATSPPEEQSNEGANAHVKGLALLRLTHCNGRCTDSVAIMKIRIGVYPGTNQRMKPDEALLGPRRGFAAS